MVTNVGFIGTGNMGSALVKGIAKSGIIPAGNIYINDIDRNRLSDLSKETGVNVVFNPVDLVEKADVIIIAVKPSVVKNVLEECKKTINNKKVIVSIAVGITTGYCKNIIGRDMKVIRAMPNTPALIGEGVTVLCGSSGVSEEDFDTVEKVFECAGKVERIDEKHMDEVIAVTGSSPAYVFMFVEAMADAAVLSGIPRDIAYRLSANAVSGSAKMIAESGKHPAELKDMVCSPGGTTIEAVRVLEKSSFRSSIIEAMKACSKKAKEICEKLWSDSIQEEKK